MTWFTALVTYIMVWWLIFFMLLPVGVHRAESVEQGHEPGAPQKPMLWKKAAITSIVTAALTALAYWLVEAEIVVISR